MDNNKKYYTAADYSRYHHGEMSAAEMHQMEKAALQDPFIQDALDGYIHTKTGEADLASLRKRIAGVEKNEVTGSSNSFKNYWKIAAVFIVAATVSFLIYNSNSDDNSQKMAKMESNRIDTPAANFNNEIAQANTTTENVNDQKISEGTGAEGDEMVVLDKPNVAAEARNLGKNIVTTKAIEKVGSNYKVDGTVVTEEGLPLTNAKVYSSDQKVLAKTDDKGNFEFESRKLDASTTIINEGYTSRQKTLNANQSATVVMKEEVQMANAPNNAAKQKVQLNATTVSNNIAQPIIGWEEYNKYLKEATPVVYNEAGVKQSGNVLLSFEVDKLGNAEKISIKKSDCADCNLAAIQLLKDGPKWVGKTAILNELSIKF